MKSSCRQTLSGLLSIECWLGIFFCQFDTNQDHLGRGNLTMKKIPLSNFSVSKSVGCFLDLGLM